MAMTEVKQNYGEFFGGKEPVELLFEDEHCVVFDEKINKQAPVHFLVVPKKMIPTLLEASTEDEKTLGHMLLVAKEIALAKGLDRTGYHVMVDEQHHTKTLKSLHVFGRALHHMVWPVGPGCRL
ncbi:hypothetical protein HF086_004170 [Spodoptera exigua]|uniref:HIT domain-containing protein n=1 Tax=Spodoptera exigua TaxID=7107 RepID=A0A922M1S1_SPOEX|nr:hypothetical protein HF086_004170 [Spodoptera exigua]